MPESSNGNVPASELDALRSENDRLRQQLDSSGRTLEEQPIADRDTGLATRGMFHARLEHEWNRALRAHEPLALLVIDIDFMHEYNGEYGRAAGDECIRRVAACVRDGFKRATEFAARHGGEDFIVLIAAVSAEEAERDADILRRRVEELGIPHPRSTPPNVVTVSVGVSGTLPDIRHSPTQLIAAAVEGLDLAKKQGRNRVVLRPFD